MDLTWGTLKLKGGSELARGFRWNGLKWAYIIGGVPKRVLVGPGVGIGPEDPQNTPFYSLLGGVWANSWKDRECPAPPNEGSSEPQWVNSLDFRRSLDKSSQKPQNRGFRPTTRNLSFQKKSRLFFFSNSSPRDSILPKSAQLWNLGFFD